MQSQDCNLGTRFYINFIPDTCTDGHAEGVLMYVHVYIVF